MSFEHCTVLLDQAVEALNIKKNGIYVDATLGGAGHFSKILQSLDGGFLIGIDKDQTAIDAARQKLAGKTGFELVKADFKDIADVVTGLGFKGVDGVLFDFGVSSPQLDVVSRGFSYMGDAPLDMRMDLEQELTAAHVINNYEKRALEKIFFEYGEERYSKSIVAAIEKQRQIEPVETTAQLCRIIKSAMPAKALKEKQHPAKRVFQAVRIEVNGELSAIHQALKGVFEILNPGGRVAAISFHSLEDRIVKQTFAGLEKGCTCPPDFPVCICGFEPVAKVITRKAALPTDIEIEQNPRARSAKLRVAERV